MPTCSTLALNTLALDAHCQEIKLIHHIDELKSLASNAQQYYVLGEGSNVLFAEKSAPNLIKTVIKGIDVQESDDDFLLTVGAGENWHQLVCYTIAQHMPGLENLALIPGSVGAAPVQNIGAYGVELADFCQSVSWFEFATQTLKELKSNDCLFGYRDSIFKGELKGKGVIVSVTLKLPKKWSPKLSYAGLNRLPPGVDAKQVMDKVIEIRNSKLPNPNELANAGSFFKNPIVSYAAFERLLKQYSDMPNYPINDSEVKLAAGWLIEQAGLKGYRDGDAGVHAKQALVLVNYGQASGADMIALARMVIAKVDEKFGVTLEPEVRIVGHAGECSIEELN